MSKSCLVVGHFEEGKGDHYVSLIPTVPDSLNVALSKCQQLSSVSFSNDCISASTLKTDNDEHSEDRSFSNTGCVLETNALCHLVSDIDESESDDAGNNGNTTTQQHAIMKHNVDLGSITSGPTQPTLMRFPMTTFGIQN